MSRKEKEKAYEELFIKAMLEPAGVLVPTSDRTESLNLRSYLYHYRRFLRETNPGFLDGKFETLKFHVEPAGLRVKLPSAPGAFKIKEALRA